ncbi:hypothetical protein WG922_13550 [Ramlibacter sp. AN1015]|uniref:hypothetical protein n=1 Tax=Ramlibacter sp. AN1015 TaxID=3133428 RepID=UPI0030C460E5
MGGVVKYSVALACLASSLAYGQSLSISFMGFELGTQQALVMEEVRRRFTVVPLSSDPNGFFLADAPMPNGRFVGALGFKDGKLNYIERTWGLFGSTTDSIKVVDTLSAALESAAKNSGSKQAIQNVSRQRTPQVEWTTTSWAYPKGWTVTMTVQNNLPDPTDRTIEIKEGVLGEKVSR